MKVKDVMSKDVATLNSSDTIEKAAQLMKQNDVGSIPVCQEHKIVGIITDRDIALRTIAEGQNPKQQKVSDIMSSDPVVGNPEMEVQDVARVMSQKQIRRLPIVENNNLVGIVALGDISVEPSEQNCAEDALKNISQSDSTM